MTNLLIKIFIKDSKNVSDVNVRAKYGILVSFTGIVLNILLSICKLIIGIISSSISIISDALNNITDVGSSVVTMIGFKLSQKKSDADHPWGHGRMEYIAGFVVDIIIMLVGIELFRTSIEKIISPSLPNINNAILVLLVIAIIAKLWLFIFYKKIAKIISSKALEASANDSISDTFSTLAVFSSAVISKFLGITIDGYVSLLVSLFIIFTGFKATKEMIDVLIGMKPDENFIKQIYEFSKKYPKIIGIHDVMVHDYGPGRKIVSLHAEVPETSTVLEAHDIVDKLEKDMESKLGCITTIHIDPISTKDKELLKIKRKTEQIVKEINNEFSIHDFRILNESEKKKIIFDLVITTEEKYSKEEIKKRVEQEIEKIYKNYEIEITVEYSFA